MHRAQQLIPPPPPHLRLWLLRVLLLCPCRWGLLLPLLSLLLCSFRCRQHVLRLVHLLLRLPHHELLLLPPGTLVCLFQWQMLPWPRVQ